MIFAVLFVVDAGGLDRIERGSGVLIEHGMIWRRYTSAIPTSLEGIVRGEGARRELQSLARGLCDIWSCNGEVGARCRADRGTPGPSRHSIHSSHACEVTLLESIGDYHGDGEHWLVD